MGRKPKIRTYDHATLRRIAILHQSLRAVCRPLCPPRLFDDAFSECILSVAEMHPNDAMNDKAFIEAFAYRFKVMVFRATREEARYVELHTRRRGTNDEDD